MPLEQNARAKLLGEIPGILASRLRAVKEARRRPRPARAPGFRMLQLSYRAAAALIRRPVGSDENHLAAGA